MEQRLPWLARTRRYGQGWAVTHKAGRLQDERSRAVVAQFREMLARRWSDV